jgi:hypothetical protein
MPGPDFEILLQDVGRLTTPETLGDYVSTPREGFEATYHAMSAVAEQASLAALCNGIDTKADRGLRCLSAGDVSQALRLGSEVWGLLRVAEPLLQLTEVRTPSTLPRTRVFLLLCHLLSQPLELHVELSGDANAPDLSLFINHPGLHAHRGTVKQYCPRIAPCTDSDYLITLSSEGTVCTQTAATGSFSDGISFSLVQFPDDHRECEIALWRGESFVCSWVLRRKETPGSSLTWHLDSMP